MYYLLKYPWAVSLSFSYVVVITALLNDILYKVAWPSYLIPLVLLPVGDLDGLHSYLDLLQKGSDSVTEWIIGGKIYLDYITIHDIVDDMRVRRRL